MLNITPFDKKGRTIITNHSYTIPSCEGFLCYSDIKQKEKDPKTSSWFPFDYIHNIVNAIV